MTIQKITKRVVDSVVAPTSKAVLLRDTEVKGFLLCVSPGGIKSYAVEYRIGKGRLAPKRRYTIGKHGSPWTPDLARVEAKRLLSQVAAGTDPLAEKYGRHGLLTVAELCDLYLREGATHKKRSTLRGDRSRIEHYLKPHLGKKLVVDVTRTDVERLVREVTNLSAAKIRSTKGTRHSIRGGPGAAFQSLAVVGAIFTFAINRGLRSGNPAARVRKPKLRKMERFLSDDEIRRLFAQLAVEKHRSGTDLPCAAIELLLLTGCRKGEIVGLTWSEVDIDHRCLRLRDSKTGQKIVYLNNQALDLLGSLPKSDNPFVIAGSKSDCSSGAVDSTWLRVRAKAELHGVRIHDLRHSFASIAVRQGASLPIIGALLGHRNASTTMRYAHLTAEPLRAATAAVGADIFSARAR